MSIGSTSDEDLVDGYEEQGGSLKGVADRDVKASEALNAAIEKWSKDIRGNKSVHWSKQEYFYHSNLHYDHLHI